MQRIKEGRPSPAFVLSLVALFVALGGTGYALSGSELKDRSVAGIKIKKSSITNKEVLESSLKPVPKADGMSLTAVVAANGSASRALGAVSSTRLGEGNYEVIFNRDVRPCTYAATIGDIGAANPGDGLVNVSQRATNVNGVQVRTSNANGTNNPPADRSFHLIVSC
jgi:hypothetical protein